MYSCVKWVDPQTRCGELGLHALMGTYTPEFTPGIMCLNHSSVIATSTPLNVYSHITKYEPARRLAAFLRASRWIETCM